MKVECKVSADYKEPYAVLYISEITETVAELVSKSAIANIRQIGHVEAGFNGTMELVMKNGTIDYISRSFRKNFKERLGLT